MFLRRDRVIKVLLSLVLVLAMGSQFALPAMADMVVEQPAPGFMTTSVSGACPASPYTTFYTYTVPTNTTATYINLTCFNSGNQNSDWYVRVLVNGTPVFGPSSIGYYSPMPPQYVGGAINAGAGSTITIQGEGVTTGYAEILASGDPSFYFTYYGSGYYTELPTFLMLEYDMANQTTAQTAATQATTAATDAAAAQTAANTAATNASMAATNASNAYTAAASANTEATTAANNTTYNSQSAAYWAANANTNASNAASYASSANTEATTAASQATGANTQAAVAASNTAYSGNTAAYWAYQADQNSASAVIPVISSVTGVSGATAPRVRATRLMSILVRAAALRMQRTLSQGLEVHQHYHPAATRSQSAT